MTHYAAPREPGDRSRLWFSLGLRLSLLALVAVVFGPSEDPASIAFVLLLVGLSFGLSEWRALSLVPRGYSVGEDGVRIEHRRKVTHIPSAGIRSVSILPGDLPAKYALRCQGWIGPLGVVTGWATRRHGVVVLDTETQRFLLSPEPVEPFVQEVLANATNARRADLPGPPFPLLHGDRVLGRGAVAIFFTAIALFFTWFYVARSPTSVSISVNRDVIVVERLAAGDVEIPMNEVLSVEPLGEDGLRGARRVNGWRLPGGIAWGTFRTEALGKFELFASGRRPAVLLNARFGKAVVTPEDPAAFIAQVRELLRRG